MLHASPYPEPYRRDLSVLRLDAISAVLVRSTLTVGVQAAVVAVHVEMVGAAAAVVDTKR